MIKIILSFCLIACLIGFGVTRFLDLNKEEKKIFYRRLISFGAICLATVGFLYILTILF